MEDSDVSRSLCVCARLPLPAEDPPAGWDRKSGRCERGEWGVEDEEEGLIYCEIARERGRERERVR